MKRRIPQEHARALFRPARVSPAGRTQVGITPAIQKYAAGFQAKRHFDTALKIVEDITSFKKIALPLDKAKRLWGRRSANDVIKTRVIYVMRADEAARTRMPAILGCTDAAVAVTAALRAAGFKAVIVRAGTHTYTKFLHGKRIYIADATTRNRKKVRLMERADKRVEKVYKADNTFAEGASLAQIGIKNYRDFFRYYKAH